MSLESRSTRVLAAIEDALADDTPPVPHPAPQATSGMLTPAEVAQLFRVEPQTIARWARSGHITAIRTPTGHRRYHEAEVYALLDRGHSER